MAGRHQAGTDQFLHGKQFVVWVPWTVPQNQVGVQVLDVHRFTDLVDLHHVRWEVPLALSATDGPGVLGPPLVVDDVGPVNGLLAGDSAPEFQECVPLVGARSLDAVAEPEVAGGARELRLAVRFGADKDRRLLVDADAEGVLALDAVPSGVHLGRHAVLRLVAHGYAVDPEVHIRTAGRFNARR